MIGVGCDLTEIGRVERLLLRQRFYQKVYTAAERADLAGCAARAAGFWAAKEAVAKAMGSGFSGFGPRDIEIYRDENGAPLVRLSGGARQRFLFLGARRLHISITHTDQTAMAFALLE
ncbi:MAG: holo-ACP synthase [Butyricicoccaceae bacterium]